jgi:hypothetical protein
MEDISADIASSLLEPILAQIDPAHLGEIDRSARIAREYGKRLALDEKKEEVINKLASEYPSYDFVIDFEEAQKLLGGFVREPTTEEKSLEQYLRKYKFRIMRLPSGFIGTLKELLTQDSTAESC